MSASARATLELALLGIPVRLEVADEGLCRRLALCYGRSTGTTREGRALEARLERCDRDWRVCVAGREERLERGDEEALRAVNHELLQALMARAREYYFVHAAVLEWRGRAIVLPGLSRAGKSTLALALVLAGARYLSDELLAWHPTRRLAEPFPRAMKVRDECVAYFPEVAEGFQGAGEARFLSFDALRADVLGTPAPVGAVVVPRWSRDEAPKLAPCTRGTALLALTSSSLNFGAHRQRSLDWLTALVADAVTFELTWREPRAPAQELLQELGW